MKCKHCNIEMIKKGRTQPDGKYRIVCPRCEYCYYERKDDVNDK